MNNPSELLLIDLSSIAHPIWHMCQSEPDANATSIKTVDRVRALSAAHPHAAVCCDSGRSFRHEIDPTYKAQRPQQDAPLKHQIMLAREQLLKDGFPVWSVKGFEADDLIATATAKALAIPDTTVLIASADKDLLQLVNHRVKAKSTISGDVLDADAVKTKFSVQPAQMGDYLALVGDASDNIVGAKGIGPKKAAELLNLYASLDELYAEMDKGNGVFAAAMRTSLIEFRTRMATVRQLIALRADVEIPFEEIAAERTPKDAAPMAEESSMEAPVAEAEVQTGHQAGDVVRGTVPSSTPRLEPGSDHRNGQNGDVQTHKNAEVVGPQALAVQQPDVLAPAPPEWGKQLEPRSLREAQSLATAMFQARLFNGYGNAPAVLSTIMAGRELGLQAIASLRGLHIVEGRHMLAADLIRGLVLRSGLAKTFRCTERTATRATFITQRGDDPEMALTYTIEEGRAAFAGDDAKWSKSGWGRNPADMLVARAGAKLARLVYPEVTFGLYSPEEFD